MTDFSIYRHLTIPDGEVQTVTDTSGSVIWRRRYVDRVPRSIGTDGKVYNEQGWKAGLRLSSSSGKETSNVGSSIIGFVPCSAGDVVRARYDGDNPLIWEGVTGQKSACSIVYYDSSFGYLGGVALNGTYGIRSSADRLAGGLTSGKMLVGVVPSNIKIRYFRMSIGIGIYDAVTNKNYSQSLEPLIVTVNEEVE